MEDIAMTLGSRISEFRRKNKITQEQLAEAMGVSAQAVSKWENDISCPDISTLPQMADFFHVTMDELMRGDHCPKQVQVLPKENRKEFDKMLLKVNVLSKGGDKVKVNLPLSIVKVSLEMGIMTQVTGENNALKNIDFESILRMAESGVVGKLVEVESANGDLVDVTIE